MKIKVGDSVKIKSLDWYKNNCDKSGMVSGICGFVPQMSKWCDKIGKIVDISEPFYPGGLDFYVLDLDCGYFYWTCDMFDITYIRKLKLEKILGDSNGL